LVEVDLTGTENANGSSSISGYQEKLQSMS